MQVVVSAAPAVAGQDAQYQVDGAGQAQHDYLRGLQGQLVPQHHDHHQLDDLDEEVKHVDQDDALLPLPVRIFLVGGLQSGTVQPTGQTRQVYPVHFPSSSEHWPDIFGQTGRSC